MRKVYPLYEKGMFIVKKAIIPAAGIGTRFLPWTKAMPKEMLPIVDKPVLQYVVEECVNSGIKDIVIVTSSHKKPIEDYFSQDLLLEWQLQKQGKIQKFQMKVPAKIYANEYILEKSLALFLWIS